jgi:RHH-type transcriptional regulator, rel operon repressor / antitoxin RelB
LYREVHLLTLRLPKTLEKRLEKLAKRTGTTKALLVREAILEHLADLEDFYLAERAFRRVQSGEDRPVPLKEVMKRHRKRR